MAQYLLSVHTVEGEAREPMSEGEMRQFMERVGVPFAESKEHLGGFYIIDAEDLDAALSWAAKTADCVKRPIEVRPFWQAPGA